jgi:hypothetical protein
MSRAVQSFAALAAQTPMSLALLPFPATVSTFHGKIHHVAVSILAWRDITFSRLPHNRFASSYLTVLSLVLALASMVSREDILQHLTNLTRGRILLWPSFDDLLGPVT